MAAKLSAGPATYADIEALPSNMVGELVQGILHANPRPAALHAEDLPGHRRGRVLPVERAGIRHGRRRAAARR